MAAAVIDRMMTLRVEEERVEEEAREEERQRADECDGEIMGDDEPRLAEEPTAQTEEETSKIRAMIVIDRKVDLVTPMLTPFTYEGLVDDVLGISTGGASPSSGPSWTTPTTTRTAGGAAGSSRVDGSSRAALVGSHGPPPPQRLRPSLLRGPEHARRVLRLLPRRAGQGPPRVPLAVHVEGHRAVPRPRRDTP
ncbi:hypothetical protein THAOC_12138 [Thalassiosira oceanica]|uniref:Uncharacterized protein n=1 Tax=Thalassiosira oceanica TaxID=159749 RepID=K0SPG2_THAOC|nr:hypothetical protein THAOC_12138 [Thalassiosira oceanica]|eukprot:EJK66894.1 hypothetical protein THAOC_12138 [Thalassiosira oceanica]